MTAGLLLHRHVLGSTGILVASLAMGTALDAQPWRPASDISPTLRHYVAHRAAQPIRIDGMLDESSWQAASWTEAFVDIATGEQVHLATMVKMLWDEASLYVAARLEEPDVWATLTTRDTIIFLDNDFEVFLDPDGDTQVFFQVDADEQSSPSSAQGCDPLQKLDGFVRCEVTDRRPGKVYGSPGRKRL